MSSNNEQRKIGRVSIVKIYSGEWIVKAYDTEGERFEEADYYTNDKKDAEKTANIMMGIPAY